ncbi:tetratricopeptide repeat protein, partial [Candidatus Roizmanbacteria bacterium]|nr:tetratricopeptide repeat protein [Candidatus Roizmanbacteria bacterium]
VSVIFFWLLALFSKETALFWIPALIFLWEWGKGFEKLLQQTWYIVALFLIGGLYGILRLQAVPEFWRKHVQDLSFSEALGTRLSVFLFRLIDVVSPFKPNFSDATPIVNMTSWKPWLAIFIFLACVFIVYRSKKKPIVSRVLFFIFITLLPALSILPLPRFSSPHYSFIAAPAAGIAAVLIGRKVMSSIGSTGKAIFILLITVWVSFMAVSTFNAGFQFKNDLTLFGFEIKRDDNFREGHFYLGDYYLRRGNYQLAAEHLEDSLRQRPDVIAFVDRPAAMINLAGTYLSLRKIDEAQKLLREVAEKNTESNRLRSIYNLAVIADRKGAYQEIVNLLDDDINQWQQPEPLLLLVKGLVKTGREDEAEQILTNNLFIKDDKKRQEILLKFR